MDKNKLKLKGGMLNINKRTMVQALLAQIVYREHRSSLTSCLRGDTNISCHLTKNFILDTFNHGKHTERAMKFNFWPLSCLKMHPEN